MEATGKNGLHERCLRITYIDKQSSFNELLQKDGSVSIHVRNLLVLATEMYKFSNNLSMPTMKDISPISKNPYNLRYNSQFSKPLLRTVWTENLDQTFWDLVTNSLKPIGDLSFKQVSKKWKPENCLCRLCKVYVQNVGFL